MISSGLQIRDIFVDFAGSVFDKESPGIILIGKRQ